VILPGFGPEGQAKLKHASVLVIGAGGLGCPALLYLAAAGVGRICVVDGDVVSLSNLNRQVLFGQQDLGKNKAQTAVRYFQEKYKYLQVK
jgi:adenylyltransferase/sulfurtransferase